MLFAFSDTIHCTGVLWKSLVLESERSRLRCIWLASLHYEGRLSFVFQPHDQSETRECRDFSGVVFTLAIVASSYMTEEKGLGEKDLGRAERDLQIKGK